MKHFKRHLNSLPSPGSFDPRALPSWLKVHQVQWLSGPSQEPRLKTLFFFQIWKVAVAHVQKLLLQSMNPMNVFCKKHLGFGIVPPEDLLHKSCPEKEGEGISEGI
jgi:hypothetical protein